GLFFPFVIYFFIIHIGYTVPLVLGSSPGTGISLRSSALGGIVHLLRGTFPSFVQAFNGWINGCQILRLVSSFQFIQSLVDRRLVAFRNFVAKFLKLFFGLEDQTVGLVKLL